MQPIHLKLTSDSDALPALREHVRRAARAVGFEEDAAEQIVLAVDEAVCNVICHGYDGCSGRPIEVGIQTLEGGAVTGMEILICDCARQVDPATIVGRDLDDIRPGGLGTHIINTIMDEVEYTPRETTGMQLRLVKWLADTGHQE